MGSNYLYRKDLTFSVSETIIHVSDHFNQGAQYSPDSRGREFIISFMENEANHGSNWQYVDLFISTASVTNVSVNVTAPRLSVGKINEKLNVTFGKVEHLKLGYNVINEGSNRSSKGLHITATDEIIVFSMNKQDTSTDGYLAFPIDVLGKTHYAVCYSFDRNKVFTSNMVVVGVKDNTKLSIKLSSHHKINIRFEGKTYRYGEWINLTLNAYDTLQLETIGDLTGSLIQGSNPIAVFTGNKKTNLYLSGGRGDRGRDHLVEQIPPIVTWGKHFATVPFPERSDGYVLRFVTSEGNTRISISGCVTKTFILNTGTFRQENIPDSSCFLTISSSKPILIAQFSKSSDGKILSDPSMFIVPPIEQYATDYIISSPPATHSAFSNYFMVIIKASEKDGLIVDGKNIQSVRASFKSIHGTELVGGYVYVGKDTKAHSIKHKSPTSVFGAVAYGGAHYESYSFPVGLRLAPINQVCKSSRMKLADGLDNDCDELIDEEICNGKDDDGDLNIDEDCAASGIQYRPDNRGTEFIISFIENDGNKGSNWKFVDLFIGTASVNNVFVNVSAPRLPDAKLKENFHISFGKVEHLKLDYIVINEGSKRSSKGILITATDEIIVFSINRQSTSTDGFLAFPTDVLGNTHYAVCYSYDRNKVFTSNLVVVGTEDNTKLTIQLSRNHKVKITFEGRTYIHDEWINITLNAYETLQLETHGDLTGSLIQADKPIAVLTGNKKTDIHVDGGKNGFDHLVEQIPPTLTWGKHFVTFPFPGRSDGYLLRFVTSEDHTSISIAGCVTETFILYKRAFRQENIPHSSCFLTINSSKPILVAQFSKSSDGKILSDPSMFIVPPIEQYAADYVISSPPATNTPFINYFMIIIKAAEKDGLIVDGKNIQSVRASFESIHGTDLVGGYVYVGNDTAPHTIKHKSSTSVFGAVAYGGAYYESYSFPLGLRLAPINQVCKTSRMTVADGLDNDCDGLIDEEICNGKDPKFTTSAVQTSISVQQGSSGTVVSHLVKTFPSASTNKTTRNRKPKAASSKTTTSQTPTNSNRRSAIAISPTALAVTSTANTPSLVSTNKPTLTIQKPIAASGKTTTTLASSKGHHHSAISPITMMNHHTVSRPTQGAANKYSHGKQLLSGSAETGNGRTIWVLPRWLKILEAMMLAAICCIILGFSLCLCKNIFGMAGRRNRDDDEEKIFTVWQKKRRPLPLQRKN
ncbi:hypothetical protein FSP39_016736 [Pinctada imbricata]|uniref:IgGFc-binding protein N-terminal domain-containing protein n=1 Tax=Pinctada imbricata TaxID=66713 RepID=A0AA88XT85_PINIB|nr:hypothetical protein FSP39_016736 [Pinctada imbricata]